ncbi:prepilin-type N-terminal cleavage/methylation domain-containing protein [Parahaliea aestuarii]|uniref:Prepilin-type N-terminal cleavage/methylation domain-containing protein n=1 Tax=Parahaliea aestuarii TaxID=1852021 RepID=A0A5C8ZN93_9GAMM|nr:prepilin-type N-terminal cleavage/methylation domain-containing protein [Parahaliea aestuarii]TXS89027.1 prepilin-type N-terminal cleavage/methylation domain-containing protein [Parahaliea aestuarii]
MATPLRTNENGFTLLELLVGVSILSLIGSAAYRVITQATESIKAGAAVTARIEQRILSHWALRWELQSLPRNIIDVSNNADLLKPFPILFDRRESDRLVLKRIKDPRLLRSSHNTLLETITYSFERNTLVGGYIVVQRFVDQPEGMNSVLHDIATAEFKIKDHQGRIVERWPEIGRRETAGQQYYSSDLVIPSLVEMIATDAEGNTISYVIHP